VRILALDTCDSSGSIALLCDDSVHQIARHSTSEDYSSWLLPGVKRVLSAEGLELVAIDVFAVAAGPGSFTGVRVGLTTVKAWAEIYARPIAAVSRLLALAEESTGNSPYVGAFFDARRSQVFAALYRREGHLHRIEEEMVISPEQFLDWCLAQAGVDSIDWISPQPACLTQLPGWAARQTRSEAVQEFNGPLAPRIGRISLRLAEQGQLTDALRLDANYIRRSDAELLWKGSHGGRAAQTWTVRNSRAEDLPALASIANASAEASQWTAESYSELGFSPNGVLLVAQSDADLLAFLAARHAASEAEILNLAVESKARRRGAASALLAAALEEFQRRGITDIFLEVRASNTPAVALYRKFGFSICDHRKSYYSNPIEDALCMTRKLTPVSG
jgi:tRNA threonylcarbamoyl adenosine modification protein YeaZ/ribosomal-protein-alanine acetyltransferase